MKGVVAFVTTVGLSLSKCFNKQQLCCLHLSNTWHCKNAYAHALPDITLNIGLAGLKCVIVLSLVMLAFSFSNASFSSAPHLNFVSLWVSFQKGAVSDAYLGMNFDNGIQSCQENFSQLLLILVGCFLLQL